AIRVSAIDIGRPGPDEESGHGRVDAPRAVEVERALAARILDPPDGATVRGTVAVSGRAGGPGLARYELAIGAGESPVAWTTLAEASSPAAGGALGTLDASALPDGLYTLRLTATDGSGRAFDDRRQVVVDEVRFDAPPPPRSPAAATVVRPGAPVALEGRADGPSFLRYRLLWAPGLHPPSGWTEDGLALESDGLRPVDGGRLATWEPPAGARAGYYSFRLLVDNEAGFTSEARTALYLEPDLLAGHWPKPVRPGPWKGNGAHAVTGAAGEPLLALTSPLDAGGTRLWRFDAHGSPADVTDDAGALDLAALHPIATAPLDARPGDEVLVAHPRLLRAWSADGSSWTFPAPPGHGLVRAVPVIEDLDGAPGLEVLAVATSFREGTGRLQAWRADGTSVGGAFPVEVPDRNLGVSNEGRQRLLVADLDGDGGKEIVLADGPAEDAFSLRLLGPDGTRRPWADPVFDGFPAALAAADLDGDSAPEVVVLAVRDLAPVLHVLDALGFEKPGWPVALGAGAPALALADLDRDGRAEVVVSAGYELHVLDATGRAFSGAWPRTGAAYFGPPVVGDVDGDGRPEIVVAALRAARIAAPPWPREAGARVGPAAAWVPPGLAPEGGGEPPARSVGYHDYELLAFRADGSLARSWRLHGAGGRETTGLPVPLLADVDGDSRTDVAVVQPLAEPGASEADEALLTVFATGAPHDEAAPDWPAVRRDGRNSSVLPVVRPSPPAR
ncbi:MAG TPA: VCBS repeat-containing protein, partial [Vicinamibacteria bacterium]